MKIAIVHEWLDTVAGSENVLSELLFLFPGADLFATVDFLPRSSRHLLRGRQPRTSFIQRLPLARRHFRSYLPLMPLAVEQHNLTGYDLVISSSHAFAKGVITGPHQTHICYCYTPMRYAWDLQHEYLGADSKGPKAWAARGLLHYLRMWDVRTAHGVDQFVADSTYVARRIQKVYGRDALVVHPPVDTEYFQPGRLPRGEWYVTASRLVPYKRIDLIVQAFASMPDRKLLVIGDGPQMDRCRKLARGNIVFAGHAPANQLREALQTARAFVFAAEEDFGIAPVEAQACGTPVLCYGRGGVLDTVIPGITGLFFSQQSPEAICEAVRRFEQCEFDRAAIRAHAEGFSAARFRMRFRSLVDRSLVDRGPVFAAGSLVR
ncbi:MAG: glycosyltransferase family 4 protein [Bryobacteraceae bacterium]|jgi:glycosyltransferase involved in cell wall biosynthesis